MDSTCVYWTHLYFLHSNGEPIFQRGQELVKVLSGFKKKIVSSLEANNRKLQSVDLMKAPYGMKVDNNKHFVIAMVKLTISDELDWLKDVNFVNVCEGSKEQLCLRRVINNKAFKETTLNFSLDRLDRVSHVVKKLLHFLNLHFVQNDNELSVKGGLQQMNFFHAVVIEELAFLENEVHITFNGKDTLVTSHMETLVSKGQIGITQMNTVIAATKLYDIGMFLFTFCLYGEHIKDISGYKIKINFNEMTVKVDMYEKKGKGTKHVDKFHKAYTDYNRNYETVSVIRNFPSEFMEYFKRTVNRIRSKPVFTASFARDKYLFFVFHKEHVKDGKKLIKEYLALNTPGPLDISQFVGQIPEQESKTSNANASLNFKPTLVEPYETNMDIVEDHFDDTSTNGIFLKNNAKAFYDHNHDKIESEARKNKVKVKVEEDDCIEVISCHRNSDERVLQMLMYLEDLYETFLQNDQSTSIESAETDNGKGVEPHKGSKPKIPKKPPHHNSMQPKEPSSSNLPIQFISRMQNKVLVTVQNQYIADTNVDVIVCAANDSLQPLGGLASRAIQSAGTRVQKECDRQIEKKGKMEIGSYFITNSGNLINNNIKQIIHAVIPVWKKKEKSVYATVLENIYWTAMWQAENMGFKTIAMTGFSGVPEEMVAESAVRSIVKFLSKDSCNITEVKCVDVNPVMIKCFIKTLEHNENFQKQ